MAQVQTVASEHLLMDPVSENKVAHSCLMRDEKEGRKKQERSTHNKAKQHSTHKAV